MTANDAASIRLDALADCLQFLETRLRQTSEQRESGFEYYQNELSRTISAFENQFGWCVRQRMNQRKKFSGGWTA